MNDQLREFIEIVWDFYHKNSRDLPWRHVDGNDQIDPYKILVSEIMLQQTQAQRVIPKYLDFLRVFPDVQSLAAAPLEAVLLPWSGLGYNRRAKFLWQAAQTVVNDFDGQGPASDSELTSLPGVGVNTARAVLAYAYNQPVTFVETNIRTVYIHHFFQGAEAVHDKELLPFIVDTVDHEHPREWYWALMDYGTFLKKTVGNGSRYSTHYVKQSKFEGSKRQIRGRVIKLLTAGPHDYESVKQEIADDRFEAVLSDLTTEGLVGRSGNILHL